MNDVVANGDWGVFETMFGGCTESIMKWLARYGLIANRMPCPAAQCAAPNPPSDMNLIKDAHYNEGFVVKTMFEKNVKLSFMDAAFL